MSDSLGNLTSGFIDLATYGEMEQRLYGGKHALTYFVRQTRKCTWFTQVPTTLSAANGVSGFNTNFSFNISRAGDYLLDTWLRLELVGPTAPIPAAAVAAGTLAAITWTKNVGHAIIDECYITFNDLVAAKFNGDHLDFWSAFTVPAGKVDVYRKMIGGGTYMKNQKTGNDVFIQGVPAASIGGGLGGLVNESGQSGATVPAWNANAQVLTGTTTVLNVPLPFFYSRDSGLALPTAALPYNDMRIQIKTRSADRLLQYTSRDGLVMATPAATAAATVTAKLWANYAIVTNDERTLMGGAPRDMVIEQAQLASVSSIAATASSFATDIRFNHSVKSLFFGVRDVYDTTGVQVSAAAGPVIAGEGAADAATVAEYNEAWSRCPGGFGRVFSSQTANQAGALHDFLLAANYGRTVLMNPFGANSSIAQNAISQLTGVPSNTSYALDQYDPIKDVTLKYENTSRLGAMPADYFSDVQPYMHSHVAPSEVGYHMYSYGLDMNSVDPDGSTNYGKLTNVNLSGNLRTAASTAATTLVDGNFVVGVYPAGGGATQARELVVTAVNWNVARVSGGAFGFPIL